MPSPRTLRHGSRLRPARRRATTALVLLAAGTLAWGCGSAGEASGPPPTGEDALLSWLPADTAMVARVDSAPARLDRALRTLSRLPAWALVEPSLPASDGAGLRRALLERSTASLREARGADAVPTVERLEAAFGSAAGFAVTFADAAATDAAGSPLVAWAEVDDPRAARTAVAGFTRGRDRRREHEGVEWFHARADGTAWLVRDGLLLAASSPARLTSLIDARSGTRSLAQDRQARVAVGHGSRRSLVGVAVQVDPLLEAGPPVARRLGAGSLAAPWVAASLVVDDVGIRLRSSWTEPRELARPSPDARALVERLPGSTQLAAGVVGDGQALQRAQATWAGLRDERDVNLRELGGRCGPKGAAACGILLDVLQVLLDDRALGEAVARGGSRVAAVASIAASPGAAGQLHALTTADALEPDELRRLRRAAERGGLQVGERGPGGERSVRVERASPVGRALRRSTQHRASPILQSFGLDARALLAPDGVRVRTRTIDGIRVASRDAPGRSSVDRALSGTGELLRDERAYVEVVAAAAPPARVGAYGWIDLREVAGAVLEAQARRDPRLRRAIPTVRNNLTDAPGVIWWSGRSRSAGLPVGTLEAVVPIFD